MDPTNGNLPIEIFTMILTMLPTKTLVKCQNVCPAWRAMIRDTSFIKRHFQHWASKGNGYLLHVPLDQINDRTFTLLHDKTFDHALDIEVPTVLELLSFIVIGSCNGLLCVADTNNYGNIIYLCNPYLRRCRSVLSVADDDDVDPSKCIHEDVNVALGFGYHDQTDDYKVVKIVFASEHDQGIVETSSINDSSSIPNEVHVENKIEVYSTSLGSWKTIQVDYFPWAMLNIKSEIVINDSIHWKVIYRDIDEDIVMALAFHLGNEVFKQIRLPNYEVDGEDLIEFLGIYQGNLSLFLFHLVDQDPIQEQCYLWVMTEYGLENSWIKTHSIVIDPRMVAPLLFTKNNEVIYDDGKQNLLICDLNSNSTRYVAQVEEHGYLNIVMCMESLVLLEG